MVGIPAAPPEENMIQEFVESGALNIVYAVVLFISFIFALLSVLGADTGDMDLDIDVDSDLGLLNLSPFVLAVFGATFGLTGLLTRFYLGMAAFPSIMWSTGVGLIVGFLGQILFIYVLSPSKSSHYSLKDDGVGRRAEVIVTIPIDGLGTIAYDKVSGRVTLGARSATGEAIHRGTLIQIERITGRVALVRPVE
jgi:membrane protein implicated in regulation of membrane protease activity